MTEQPLPKPGDRPVMPEVRRLMDERERFGIENYKRPLETFNGRSFLRDATEEALDLTQYLVGLRMELEEALGDLEYAYTHYTWGMAISAAKRLRTILGKGG